MKHKQTSSLVEALLCSFNVAFEDLLGTKKDSSASFQVLRIICCDFLHPVLFGFCSLRVTVIVSYLNIINQPNAYKLWEVWDSRRCSVEILQTVNHYKKILINVMNSVFIPQFNKLLNNVIVHHTNSEGTIVHSRLPDNL